jgi:hypothetical protein
MPRTKGTGVAWLRELIGEKGPAAEQEIAKSLSAEDYRLFRTAMPIVWVPEESATNIYRAAGNLIFAGSPNPLIEVGRGMAKNNLTGIYSILVQFTSIPFLMKQASRLWKTYHDTGRPAVDTSRGERILVFSVAGFPELPADMRQVLKGYILGLADLVKVRRVEVELDESDPAEWKWLINWD